MFFSLLIQCIVTVLNIIFFCFALGVPIRTHKPKAFKPNDASRGNINYRMKLAFLSQETIPDYRPIFVSTCKLQLRRTRNQSVDFL